MRFNVTNRTTGVRSFQAGGRFLTLAGGESERNVDLNSDEADALRATNEFYVTELEAPPVEKPAIERAAKPAPVEDFKTITLKP